MKLFHVFHHEIMGATNAPRTDEMLFYTASTLKKALAMIKRSHVSKWSWWEIQTQELDTMEWPKHLGSYGPRAGKLKKSQAAAHYEKCLAIFLEERKHGRT